MYSALQMMSCQQPVQLEMGLESVLSRLEIKVFKGTTFFFSGRRGKGVAGRQASLISVRRKTKIRSEYL